ncbi:cytochrome ubiquinol oxidase subunit I [uncultured Bacteroides sp.]|uniref:cytochrome ubiquinol oxidase subunit I n=1 Tax=uncultured Bacteroides sp. TaxID=162156 RepID=UPI002AABB559|nr:cytochrome ubiquinol oxidase subunit I [uncultured Bacteroides sp.]
MLESIDPSLIDWSRAQFALTAMYHWLFVPLTLGLALIMAIMETLYYKTGKEFWKKTAKFWMKLFGINFAIGVATGIILEFEFGTNWSNYSWFVGDIFGAPLAIEGILAFFMESTFIAVIFFGWNKVGKGFHLASTWLTGIGATLSAWWILVANAWMQNPVGMEFNPDTVRNEMMDFFAVAFSPVALSKFLHSVLSGWILGAILVVGISAWFLFKKRDREFAIASMKIGAIVGLASSLLVAWTGDSSAYLVAQTQPMKLAAMEGYYNGQQGAPLEAVGFLNPDKKSYNDNIYPFIVDIKMPKMLSFLATRNLNGYVPGIKNIIDGGYKLKDGTIALPASDKIAMGKTAISALSAYRAAMKAGNRNDAMFCREILKSNIQYLGYGYIKDVNDLIPNVMLTFYAFRIMVILGGYFILFFALVLFMAYKKNLAEMKWMHWVAMITIPLGYIAGQAGWVVAEVGRQPWAIQDMLPISASISKLDVGSVQTTFFIFLLLFTVMLIAEIRIMLREIKKGPEA